VLLGMPTRLTARKRLGSEQVQNETPITLLVRMRLTCSLAHCLRQTLLYSFHARGERFIVEKEVHARCHSRGAMFRVRPARIAGTRWNAALAAEYDSADSYYPGRHWGGASNRRSRGTEPLPLIESRTCSTAAPRVPSDTGDTSK